MTLQVELASPDVDQSREITAIRDRGRNRGRGGLSLGTVKAGGEGGGDAGCSGSQGDAAGAVTARQECATLFDSIGVQASAPSLTFATFVVTPNAIRTIVLKSIVLHAIGRSRSS